MIFFFFGIYTSAIITQLAQVNDKNLSSCVVPRLNFLKNLSSTRGNRMFINRNHLTIINEKWMCVRMYVNENVSFYLDLHYFIDSNSVFVFR